MASKAQMTGMLGVYLTAVELGGVDKMIDA